MMADYYIRASLLTAALTAGTARLGRPVNRLRVLPDDRCLASAGWRRLVLTGRNSGGGYSGEGEPVLGGGSWGVEEEGTDNPSCSPQCASREAMLHAVISYASGDLQALIDEVVVQPWGRLCRIRSGADWALYEAMLSSPEGWWRIERVGQPAEPPSSLTGMWRRLRGGA